MKKETIEIIELFQKQVELTDMIQDSDHCKPLTYLAHKMEKQIAEYYLLSLTIVELDLILKNGSFLVDYTEFILDDKSDKYHISSQWIAFMMMDKQ